MTTLRMKVGTSKMENHKLNSAPELRSLPPTSEYIEKQILKALLQTAIWRLYKKKHHPQLNPTDYGC